MARTARLPRPEHADPASVDAYWREQHAADLAALAADPPARANLFRSFFLGGFECSTHRRAHDRARVDVIAATRHDVSAAADYRLLADHGIGAVRDGLRWHLIDADPARRDWTSLDPMLAAAADTGTQVIWDLLHYGWPDWIDVWSDAFVARFAEFAAAAAARIAAGAAAPRFYAPVNEISFLAFAGGDRGFLNPFAHDRGDALKRQLGRAAVAAMAAVRAVDAGARFVQPEPLIHITAAPGADAGFRADAERHRGSQYHAWDMIAGGHWPEVGGRADLLDVIGVNYYSQNQWLHYGETLAAGDPLAKPFRYMLVETFARYRRPIFIAETGIEGDARPDWLAHICDEVRGAMRLGVPIEGICLYPVLNHPGWDNDRNCPNGLLEFASGPGPRTVHRPLADELARQRSLFAAEFRVA